METRLLQPHHWESLLNSLSQTRVRNSYFKAIEVVEVLMHLGLGSHIIEVFTGLDVVVGGIHSVFG